MLRKTLTDAWGVYRADAFAKPRRPMDLLVQLAQVPRAIVVHGNYLDSDELRFLGQLYPADRSLGRRRQVGTVQLIRASPDGLRAASDPRKGGRADGF